MSRHQYYGRQQLQAVIGDQPETLIKEETTHFLWDGDVLLAESTDTRDPLELVYMGSTAGGGRILR